MKVPPQGAFPSPEGTTFRVWAPHAQALWVELDRGVTRPLTRDATGMFEGFVADLRPGARYRYLFPDQRRRPDPASRLQEGSVHGSSTVVDLKAFPWTDEGWRGVPQQSLVFYELHVGTFTPEGTFDAAIRELPRLKALGVTALEPMPVAAFDGPRGWGYDGVLLYAVHAPYGGPQAFMRFVDACHAQGMGVVLDVVYNHLGPSGNYLRDFGPYFTDAHHTPWGEAVNYDREGSPFVRSFVIENALQFLRDFHCDGLRLDAVHGIVDTSRTHLLRELNDRVQELSAELARPLHVIAESDLNDPTLIRPVERGGHGLAGQWTDDFHHALHVLLTGERAGYYADFGRLEDLARSFREAFVYTGQPSVFRGKPHGASAAELPGRKFVTYSQDHDQVGNRAIGERLTALVPPEALRLAAAATLLSPHLPLLFMGEEYGEKAPFQYFTSFPDEALGKAVSEGRQREFRSFGWKGEVPDPQSPATFSRSRIDTFLAQKEPHASLQRLYGELLRLRREEPALGSDAPTDREVSVDEQAKTLLVRRRASGREALLVLRMAGGSATLKLPGKYLVQLDSWATKFTGGGGDPLPVRVEGELTLGPWHAALLVAER